MRFPQEFSLAALLCIWGAAIGVSALSNLPATTAVDNFTASPYGHGYAANLKQLHEAVASFNAWDAQHGGHSSMLERELNRRHDSAGSNGEGGGKEEPKMEQKVVDAYQRLRRQAALFADSDTPGLVCTDRMRANDDAFNVPTDQWQPDRKIARTFNNSMVLGPWPEGFGNDTLPKCNRYAGGAVECRFFKDASEAAQCGWPDYKTTLSCANVDGEVRCSRWPAGTPCGAYGSPPAQDERAYRCEHWANPPANGTAGSNATGPACTDKMLDAEEAYNVPTDQWQPDAKIRKMAGRYMVLGAWPADFPSEGLVPKCNRFPGGAVECRFFRDLGDLAWCWRPEYKTTLQCAEMGGDLWCSRFPFGTPCGPTDSAPAREPHAYDCEHWVTPFDPNATSTATSTALA